jgi:glycosyltransferase involved in cell wall biosynthesis
MNVLYLSYDGLTDPLGESQVLPYLCGLSDMGYQFTIVSFEKPDRLSKRLNEIEGICHQHNLIWLPLRYHKRPPILSTLFDLYILCRTAKRQHKLKKFKIVHCRSYLVSLTGLWLKKKFGLKFIFDMRGFWADERVEGKIWNLKNPMYSLIYKYFKNREKKFIRFADKVITLTENAKNEISGWRISNIGQAEIIQKISVIPTCVDTSLFDPGYILSEDQMALRNYLGIDMKDNVFLYFGSLGTWYMMNEMMDFFYSVKKQVSNCKFLILTNDLHFFYQHNSKNKIVDKISMKIATHLTHNQSSAINISEEVQTDSPVYNSDNGEIIITHCPRHLVPLYIGLSMMTIAFIQPSYSKKGSSATKLAESLAMGVPVVTNTGWGDIDILKSKSGMYFISKFSEEEYLRVIKDFYNTSLDHSAIRQSAINMYTLNYGIECYNNAYGYLKIKKANAPEF